MRVFEVVVSMPLSNEGWRSFFFSGAFSQKVTDDDKTLSSFFLKTHENPKLIA